MKRGNVGREATRKISRALWGAVESLTDRELKAAARTVARFSVTNCGWWEYAMRDTLASIIESEQVSRRRARSDGGGTT
jgi:hypothetical protein